MNTENINVLMEPLTERAARNVAPMLKGRGYTRAIIEDCRKRSPIEIASYFEPYDEIARMLLVQAIAQVAGIQPKKGK